MGIKEDQPDKVYFKKTSSDGYDLLGEAKVTKITLWKKVSAFIVRRWDLLYGWRARN